MDVGRSSRERHQQHQALVNGASENRRPRADTKDVLTAQDCAVLFLQDISYRHFYHPLVESEILYMGFSIRDAEKYKQYARVCFWGSPKSGKTHAALAIARGLVGPDALVGVISSEYGSSALLARKFPHKILDLSVDEHNNKIKKDPFSCKRYEEAIAFLLELGCEAIVIDSISHAWEGEGGILQNVNANKNTFSDGWGKVGTPMYKHLVDTILSAKCHMLVTIRAKDGWVMEPNADGKQVPRNAGAKPVIKGSFGYEMQLTLRMDRLVGHIDESAFQDEFPQGAEIHNPEDVAGTLLECLDGTPLPEPSAQQAEMRRLLDEFYAINPAKTARFANWEQMAIRAAMGIESGQLPTDYTDDQVEAMRGYVELKKAPKQAPVAAQPAPVAQEPAEVEPEPQVTEASVIPVEPVQAAPQQAMIIPGQANALKSLYRRLSQKPPADLSTWTFSRAAETITSLQSQLKFKQAS
jgi:hypothetical protein